MGHCIHAVLFPPFQDIKNRKFIQLPFGWKMAAHPNPDGEENAILISTDYFGGMGEQDATVIKEGKILAGSEWNKTKYHPINDALKFFGLQKTENNDEFDTINLGHYRDNDDILEALGEKRSYDYNEEDDVKHEDEDVKVQDDPMLIVIDWKKLSKIIDNVAYKVFKSSTGEKEPEKGFREIFPVIESKESLEKTLQENLE